MRGNHITFSTFKTMVALEQIEALLDFLEVRPDLALGNMSKSKEGRGLAKHLWIECAQILNSVTEDCPKKSPENWRTLWTCTPFSLKYLFLNKTKPDSNFLYNEDEYTFSRKVWLSSESSWWRFRTADSPVLLFYNEYKFKLLKKVKILQRDLKQPGGYPSARSLTPLQRRLYLMLGLDFGEPLLGGTYDPLYQDSENGVGEDSSQNYSYKTISTENGPVKKEVEDKSKITVQELIYGDEVSPSPSATNADQSQSVPLDEDVPRRRRIQNNFRRVQTQDYEPSSKRLRRMETATAKAIQKQARATNRLAAAIERISDRLNKPLVVLVKQPSGKKKRYCEIVMSSESSESDDSSSGSSDDKIIQPSKSKSPPRNYGTTSRD